MIHPYFIVTHRLDHQVHFSHRGMTGSTLITGTMKRKNPFGSRRVGTKTDLNFNEPDDTLTSNRLQTSRLI
jgi:hypothetical protein